MSKLHSFTVYDLYCIAHSENKNAAFEDLELLKKVVNFKMKFFPRKWAKYEEAIPGTIKLVPPAFRFDSLRTDYEDMAEMMFGQYDIVNIGLHFFLKNVRPYATSCSEA